MIKAVLLDLDDTLLGNPPMPFTRKYLAALEAYLYEHTGFANAAQIMTGCVQEVIRDCDPRRTNETVFYEHLQPHLPVDRELFASVAAQFYVEVYPQLQVHTERRPAARALVDWLVARRFTVAVATNPFFPRAAVEHRLSWAGVPVHEIPFALVTTLENVHFTKPHPHYYEEILARIGVQADEALMVGDDPENDIIPAREAGLNTFWVVNDPALLEQVDTVQPDGYGTLDQLAVMVQEENWLDTLEPRSHTVEQVAPRLLGNLAALFGMVQDVPPGAWHMHPDKAEWSPIEVLCHLVESEQEIQLPRLKLIAERDNPFLSQPKEPPAPSSRMCPEDVWMVAHAFARARYDTIEFLESLNSEQWARPARHYIFGPTTLLEVAHFLAQHDRLHLTQLCQTVGRCE